MRAVTWQGKRDVQTVEVPDPKIEEPTDAIIKVTSTGICGSDLHLYEVLGAVHGPRATSSGTSRWASSRRSAAGSTSLAVGDRVVVPFQIACGHCFMCDQSLQTQCETTQVTRAGHGRGAVRLHQALRRRCPAGRPSTCASRRRSTARSRCRTVRPTTGSSTSPTCCRPPGRPCEYADVPPGGTRRRARPGPDRRHGRRIAPTAARAVIGVDLVPERLERARARGVEVARPRDHKDDLGDAIRDMTAGAAPTA